MSIELKPWERFLSSAPGLWQMKAGQLLAFAMLMPTALIALALPQFSTLAVTDIPDVAEPYYYAVVACALFLMWWAIAAVAHYKVGQDGYPIKAPGFWLLVASLLVATAAPHLYAAAAYSRIASLMSKSDAAQHYLVINRVAGLLGHSKHQEALSTLKEVPLLGSSSGFTNLTVANVAAEAAPAIRRLARADERGTLMLLVQNRVPQCANENFSNESSDGQWRRKRMPYDAAIQAASTKEQRWIEEARLSEARNEHDAEHQRVHSNFVACLDRAKKELQLEPDGLAKSFSRILRSSYIIHYSHLAFGVRSGAYRQHLTPYGFAAPEYVRIGAPGDVAHLAIHLLTILVIAILIIVSNFCPGPDVRKAAGALAILWLATQLVGEAFMPAQIVSGASISSGYVDRWLAASSAFGFLALTLGLAAMSALVLPASTALSRFSCIFSHLALAVGGLVLLWHACALAGGGPKTCRVASTLFLSSLGTVQCSLFNTVAVSFGQLWSAIDALFEAVGSEKMTVSFSLQGGDHSTREPGAVLALTMLTYLTVMPLLLWLSLQLLKREYARPRSS